MSGSRRGKRQGWERERWKERQVLEKLGGQKFIGGTEMDQYLCDYHIKVYYNIEKRKFLAQFQF